MAVIPSQLLLQTWLSLFGWKIPRILDFPSEKCSHSLCTAPFWQIIPLLAVRWRTKIGRWWDKKCDAWLYQYGSAFNLFFVFRRVLINKSHNCRCARCPDGKAVPLVGLKTSECYLPQNMAYSTQASGSNLDPCPLMTSCWQQEDSLRKFGSHLGCE